MHDHLRPPAAAFNYRRQSGNTSEETAACRFLKVLFDVATSCCYLKIFWKKTKGNPMS